MLIKNFKKYNYNSFIFGSSRTIGFKPSDWEKYLQTNDIPFVFDASRESIYGIHAKFKLLDTLNIKIDNALIILCRDCTFSNTENDRGHLYIKHPAASGESYLKFHLEFFKAFLTPRFLFNFLSFKIIGEYKSFMNGYIENRQITNDAISNELRIIDQEKEIASNPDLYYLKRQNLFYDRENEKIDQHQQILSRQEFMLNEIKLLLQKNHSNYKVILSPLYEQIEFNPKDLVILKKIFGNNVYDFTGKNRLTDNKTNYFETNHFRPSVGDSIMSNVYK
jgi:hypothetical protein